MTLSVADFQGPEKIPEDSVTGTRNQGFGYLLKLISNISKIHSVIFELTDVACFYFENYLPCYLLQAYYLWLKASMDSWSTSKRIL